MNKKPFLAALSLMLVAIVGFACSGADESGMAGGDTAEVSNDGPELGRVEQEERGLSAASDAMSAEGGTSAGSGGGSGGYEAPARARSDSLPDLGLSVIKTATVALEVPDGDLQESIQNATSTAEKYGGFVVSTHITDSREHPSGAIVARVPAARFGDALADLQSLGKVRSENVSGQDVTQEFIDLQARLRNYTAQETVLLRLMKRAQNVIDTIRVQNELQRVQLEVERLRGRITYLEDQTAMSTIELRVTEEGAAAAAPGEFRKAWERAKNGLVAVIAGLISSLGVVVPIALLALLVFFVVSRLRPRVTN